MSGTEDQGRAGMPRRTFLLATAGTGASLAFVARPKKTQEEVGPGGAFAPTLWWQMDAEGRVELQVTKAEMGQHVGTAMAQVLAEELAVPMSALSIAYASSDPKWGLMVTGGSWSINWTFESLLRSGVAGRTALVAAAGKRLSVDPLRLEAREGRVFAPGGRSISYGELVAEGVPRRRWDEAALAALPLKPRTMYRVVGQPVPALDIPDKVTGRAIYGWDIVREGMLWARPIVPPVRKGARVAGIDASEARAIPGFVKALPIEDPSGTLDGWVACVAETLGAAVAASAKVRVEWDRGPNATIGDAEARAEALRAIADGRSGGLWVDEGDAESALAEEGVLEATYDTDAVLHATLEPPNALAEEIDGVWHLHAGVQFPTATVPLVAKALGVAEDRVVLHQALLGGGFGRRLYGDYLLPAALVAKALERPVKVVYTRPDDLSMDCARSPSVQRLRARLVEGRIEALAHDVAAAWPTHHIAPGLLVDGADGRSKVDSFAVAGADHWYDVPNHRVRAVRNDVVQRAFPPGYLRAVGPGFTYWAVESFMDELAAVAGADPVAFRLAHLRATGRNAGQGKNAEGGAKRLAAVLQAVADRSGWSRSRPSRTRALGVACSAGQERAMPTWTAAVADVSVDAAEGSLRVHKIWVVSDSGLVINPDGARSQIENAVLWGMSLALVERVSLRDGALQATNFGDYPVLRNRDLPELDLHVIPSRAFPVGLGEPALTVVAPAIGNAVFRATGARLRALPMTPPRVLAALAEARRA